MRSLSAMTKGRASVVVREVPLVADDGLAGARFSAHKFSPTIAGTAWPVRGGPPGLWSQFWSHSLPFAAVHGRPRAPRLRWPGRWRTPVNSGAQYSKACEGATLPWVQIPPPPPVTCKNTNLGS